ncbi:MAG: ATP-binding protein [Casimicrobiaceae bacterium]
MAVLLSESSPSAPALHDGTQVGTALGTDSGDAAHLSWVHTLYELGQAITVGSSPYNVHQQMLEHIVTGFGAHSGSIALRVDPDDDVLELVAGTDLPPGMLGSRLPPAVGVYGHVLATGEALLINGDVAETRLPVRTNERADRSKHSTMCWPLRVNDQIIGAVAINRLPTQARYTVSDLDRGQVVTNLLALVVANHRMHLERESRIVELSTLNELMRRMNQQLEEAQDQLMQSEKLASIGQIAAGVAHEINNPIGFVLSNLTTLESYLPSIFELFDAYEKVDTAADPATAKIAARGLRDSMQFDYVRGDTTALLKESLEGILRVKHIVQDLKDFSRGAVNELWDTIDLHEALDRMLNIAKSEIKYKVSIETAYGDLPLVECQSSRLHQVFLNLLVNAAQSIEVSGTVRISTGRTASEVWICFEDTGCGIPNDQLSRIFDPFFTTKQVGKGTGLGLSVSYAIVNRHDGRIEVESEVGRGTRFKVWIPIVRKREYPARPMSAEAGDVQLPNATGTLAIA